MSKQLTMVGKLAANGSMDLIADLHTGCFPHQTQHNAHLIAASPELLAVLEAVDQWHGLDGDGITEPLRSQVKAVIAKAKGIDSHAD